MAAVAGFGLVREIERDAYHKQKERSGERGDQGVGEQLVERFAPEDAALEFDVQQARRDRD
jgi:hypothetical protein